LFEVVGQAEGRQMEIYQLVSLLQYDQPTKKMLPDEGMTRNLRFGDCGLFLDSNG
jgi:hypothetical protein